MIITCNCGEKKFTLPDNSIPLSGRMVQCGFCGLKWKQFPVNEKKETQSAQPQKTVLTPTPFKQDLKKSIKTKKRKIKKPREINLYSPEYLAKKHGIKIKEETQIKIKKNKDQSYSIGFYNWIILLLILFTTFFGILNLTKSTIVTYYPFMENYIFYLYDTIENIRIIIFDFLSAY